jgi:prepilin-type processing-associated H-X9-DG protein
MTTVMADLTDGSSGTVAYAEMLTGNIQNGPFRGNSAVANTGAIRDMIDFRQVSTYQTDLQTVIQQCNADWAKNDTHEGGQSGLRWGAGAMGYASFNTVIPPNGGGQVKWNTCRTDGCCAQAQHAHFQVASSNHSGGINVLFADGSVKFVKDTITPSIWWSIGSRAGGETVSADAY